jgi:hypothetical protein
MSKPLSHKPLTVAQRAAQAAAQAATYLGTKDAKLLGAILAESALAELRRNADFAARVSAAYEAAAPKPKPPRAPRPPRQGGSSRGKTTKIALTPIKEVGTHQINIAAEVDPYFLYDVFGREQLPLALEGFSKKKLLDEVVPIVQRHHPDARPNANADKKGVITFIVQHVVSD